MKRSRYHWSKGISYYFFFWSWSWRHYLVLQPQYLSKIEDNKNGSLPVFFFLPSKFWRDGLWNVNVRRPIVHPSGVNMSYRNLRTTHPNFMKLYTVVPYARITLSRLLRRWQHDYGNFRNRDWSYPDRAIRSAIFYHRRTIGHFF